MQYNMSRIISFIVLLAFIIVIGALFYKVMIGFLIPIFLAAVLVVVFRPVHRWVYEKSGRREHIAAGITTAIILFVVLLPAGVVVTTGFIQGAAVVKNFNANNIDVTLDRLRNYLKLEIPHGEQLKEIQIEMEDLQDAVISEDDVTKLYSSTQKFGSHVKRLKDEIEALKTTLVEESRHAKPRTRFLKTRILKRKVMVNCPHSSLRMNSMLLKKHSKNWIPHAWKAISPTSSTFERLQSDSPIDGSN